MKYDIEFSKWMHVIKDKNRFAPAGENLFGIYMANPKTLKAEMDVAQEVVRGTIEAILNGFELVYTVVGDLERAVSDAPDIESKRVAAEALVSVLDKWDESVWGIRSKLDDMILAMSKIRNDIPKGVREKLGKGK